MLLPEKMIAVSIIIPCYNESKTIARVLEAIYHQTYPREKVEVVIADGNSTDGTRQSIVEFQARHPDLSVQVVDNAKRSIPAGLNAALRAAQGEIIIRMDGHSIPNPDYVENCVAGHSASLGDNIGGVWDIQPGGKGWVSRSIALAAAHPLGVGDAGYRLNSRAGKVDTVPFGSYQRSLFTRIGFFDETLLSNEDYEFNTRIRVNGGSVYLDPKIRCQYIARDNFGCLGRQYFRYGYWKLQMLRRYPDSIRWRQAIPPVFVLSLIVLLLLFPFWQLARYFLLVELILYLAALCAASIPLALKHRDARLALGVPLSIAVMHLCWGGGFLWSLIKTLAGRAKITADNDSK